MATFGILVEFKAGTITGQWSTYDLSCFVDCKKKKAIEIASASLIEFCHLDDNRYLCTNKRARVFQFPASGLSKVVAVLTPKVSRDGRRITGTKVVS